MAVRAKVSAGGVVGPRAARPQRDRGRSPRGTGGGTRGRRRGHPFSGDAFRSLVVRIAEHALAGLVLGLGLLSTLGRVAGDGRPWVLAGSLVLAAAVGGGALVAVDRARRGTGRPGRLAIDALLVLAVVLLARLAPPQRAMERLDDLLAGERATQERVIRHQVYAAYRRMDLADRRRLLGRADGRAALVERAAASIGVDSDLLMGVASTESSFLPRDSADGGRGLFQVTAPPPAAVARALRVLGVAALDLGDDLHNATLAAATLAEYGRQMGGDLFLTLLAYNIGPRNGGLATILRQYGARNFAQVQPYLQPLPREYPVRVLSAALAWRLWRRHRDLPRYEDPAGGRLVQSVGIPGLGPGAGGLPAAAASRR